MHSVQAAPRQRSIERGERYGIVDALRAGSAEAKGTPLHIKVVDDEMHSVQAAPRQSSTVSYCAVSAMMHSVQAAQSKITTCRPMVL